jgi:hypothetical protein
MGVFALTNATIYGDGYDFTGDTNKIVLKADVDVLESTVFVTGTGPGYKTRVGGLRSAELAQDGFWQSATLLAPDPQIFPNLTTVDRVWTVSPDGQVGSVAYLAQLGQFTYEAFGAVGQLTPFTVDAMGTNAAGMVRGQVAKAKAAVSATGALGSGQQLGAVGATQYLYGALHIFSAGTTITVVVESDDNSGFTSATTVQTIGPLTTAGGTWVTRTAGALTDNWFRYRITAITGSFTVAASLAVG